MFGFRIIRDRDYEKLVFDNETLNDRLELMYRVAASHRDQAHEFSRRLDVLQGIEKREEPPEIAV